jgi:hypothetical protein
MMEMKLKCENKMQRELSERKKMKKEEEEVFCEDP